MISSVQHHHDILSTLHEDEKGCEGPLKNNEFESLTSSDYADLQAIRHNDYDTNVSNANQKKPLIEYEMRNDAGVNKIKTIVDKVNQMTSNVLMLREEYACGASGANVGNASALDPNYENGSTNGNANIHAQGKKVIIIVIFNFSKKNGSSCRLCVITVTGTT